jgi:molybdate transport system substrate-binding protein
MIKRAFVAVVAATVVLAAQPAAAKPTPSGDITVFAAASLTESFTEIKRDFQAKHPDVAVKLNFDSSSNLAAQIQQGAPADVFASADEASLGKTIESGDVMPRPVTFARNRLEIAVDEGNPKRIKGLADLAKEGVIVTLCADPVPCGKYAADAFAKAGVEVTPASKEGNAKAALSKVSLGEADAAVVYVTDVKAAKGAVSGVPIPDRHNVVARYTVAVVKESDNGDAARAWARFLASAKASATLAEFGFLLP